MSKKTWCIGSSLSTMLLLGACGSDDGSSSNAGGSGNGNSDSSNFEEMTITFSHNQPEESPEHTGAVAFKDYVEENTDGSVTVDLYPASQMGSLREQVEGTQIGEIDITMQPSAVVSPFVDDVKVIDLPYLWPENNEDKYEVLDSEVGDELLGTLEEGGFTGMGYWPGGFKLFTTSGTEIHEPSDFEGLTMRTMEAPALLEQYDSWGGNAEPVPYAEVYNALQQGVVDGQENPLQTIYLNNYQEVQDYIIESNHGTMTYLLMANQGWFEGLDENLQNVLTEAEAEGVEAARGDLADKEGEYREELQNTDGVEYYELTDEEKEVFREESRSIHDEVYSEDDQQELLEKFYDKIDEVSEE